jgi:PncC family amidohydrolase
MDRGRSTLVGTTASGGVVTARIRAIGEDAEGRVAEAAAEVERRWHPYAFARGPATLAEATGRRLEGAGRRLVTCESCTGGLLGAMVTSVAGSSAWYAGGWVTYEDAAKRDRLGVPASLLAAHGAVSAEVAMAMAIGGLVRGAADEALSITGIAGPGGATPGKPVGTVWIGHASRERGDAAAATPVRVRARRFRFRGERATVRDRSATMALAMLRLSLDGHETWPPERTRVPLLWEEPRHTRRADRRALAAVGPLLAATATTPAVPTGTAPAGDRP